MTPNFPLLMAGVLADIDNYDTPINLLADDLRDNGYENLADITLVKRDLMAYRPIKIKEQSGNTWVQNTCQDAVDLRKRQTDLTYHIERDDDQDNCLEKIEELFAKLAARWASKGGHALGMVAILEEQNGQTVWRGESSMNGGMPLEREEKTAFRGVPIRYSLQLTLENIPHFREDEK